jgi:hypothetical protein
MLDVQEDHKEEDKAENHVILLRVQVVDEIMQDKVNHNKTQ